MKLWYSAPLIFLSALGWLHQGFAQSLDTRESEPTCDNVLQRREWRSLGEGERKSYINAVLCFQKLRPADPNNGIAKSRFDEFQGHHVDIANEIHAVGQFLPWHRYFLIIYEKALREECGYNGAQPYWDWTIDADAEDQNPGSFFNSPIFDVKTGFGGNGARTTYPPCVKTGPFADLTLHYGPGRGATTHCLTRGFDDSFVKFLNSGAVANTTAQNNFEDFRIELEGEPVTTVKMHDAGHLGVGGDLSNVYSSPGDPIFYTHHANLDRIWRQWQIAKPGRFWDISGRSSASPPYENITLDYPLDMGPLAATVPIRRIMDTMSSPWCYTYV